MADAALALLLDVTRRISAADRFVRRGAWLKERFPLATRFSAKRLGIFGLGRIGRAIAHRAAAFGMEIRYTSRRPVVGVAWTHEPKLIERARWADFVVVARGSVIDERALVRALVERRIGGAGLDVFENEPHVPPALLALDNVVLLPHVASATRETRQGMGDLVFANLRAHFDGQPLVTPIPGLSA